LLKELPTVAGLKPIPQALPRPVIDEDVTQIQAYLQHAGMHRLGKDPVHQAVDRHAHDRSFHKLRDWLKSLVWDGRPRLEKWLVTYLGADDTPYHRGIGKMFLIAMAARDFEPGCQADYVLILQGPQGAMKSSVCRVLAGEYFSDSLPPIHSKDASQHMRGLWLVELPELSALSRSDIESWKAFITRSRERYRQPYGRKEAIEPRQLAFMGTTNKDEYLQDETGNRRFWPARIGKIDLESLKRDREQLFAEAVHCYRKGDKWWPDAEFEQEHILPEQDARFEEDVWTPLIEENLRSIPDGKTRICDVARALDIEDGRMGTADARRIRRVLHRLGWRQRGRLSTGRFYYKPET
jgi:predicted P-loop ATPase